MRSLSAALFVALVWCPARMALGDVSVDSTRAVLLQMQQQAIRGEIVLSSGQRAMVRVDTVRADSVVVRQRLGPLYQQYAVYALADVDSVYRHPLSPRQVEPPASKLSMPTALGLELLVPGAGYLYAGEKGTALSLAGMSVAAAVTALATGTDGAAAWIPAVAWMKIAAILDVRDRVRAVNHSGTVHHGRAHASAQPDLYRNGLPSGYPAFRIRWSLSVGRRGPF